MPDPPLETEIKNTVKYVERIVHLITHKFSFLRVLYEKEHVRLQVKLLSVEGDKRKTSDMVSLKDVP